MIAIVDYGAGNLKSVAKAFEFLGVDALLTDDPEVVRDACAVVLPGVGAFRSGYEGLCARGLVAPLRDSIEAGKPFLGICLGLQLLFEESEEDGPAPGLGILKGRVVRFGTGRKVPHMGWNQIIRRKDPPMLDGIGDDTFFYFVHSYHVVPEDASIVATETDYGGRFCSSVAVDNLFACQFHPEKSQRWGLRLLENFRKVVENAGRTVA